MLKMLQVWVTHRVWDRVQWLQIEGNSLAWRSASWSGEHGLLPEGSTDTTTIATGESLTPKRFHEKIYLKQKTKVSLIKN